MPRKTSNRRLKGRGAILVIATLLFSSAALRLGTGAGDAIAQVLTQPMKQAPNAARQEDVFESSTAGTASKTVDRAGLDALLTALLEREQRVEKLESKIEIRKKALEVADEEIQRRLTALVDAEEKLRRTLAIANDAAESDLVQLTSVYENMKPKEAAAIFAEMEPDFAAGFLGRMRSDTAAAIMTGLPPETAYSISAILAGRNANIPKT